MVLNKNEFRQSCTLSVRATSQSTSREDNKLQNLTELVQFLKGKPHMLVTRYEVFVSITLDTAINSNGVSKYYSNIFKEEEEKEPNNVPLKNKEKGMMAKSFACQTGKDHILAKNPLQLNCDSNRDAFSVLRSILNSKKVSDNDGPLSKFHGETREISEQNNLEVEKGNSNSTGTYRTSLFTSEKDSDSSIDVFANVKNYTEVDLDSEIDSTIDSPIEINANVPNWIEINEEPEIASAVESPNKINANMQNFVEAYMEPEITSAVSLDMDASDVKQISSSACESVKENHNPFKCSVSGLMFQKDNSTRDHTMSHSTNFIEPLRFECPLCDYSCKTNTIIIYHAEKKHHTKVHLCLWCRFVALSEEQLANHESQRNDGNKCIIKKKMGVERGLCSQCGYLGPDTGCLKRHILVHIEEKAYKCPVCPMSYRSERQLRRHANIHSRLKSFRCSQCFYATHNNYTLTQHMKRHLDEGKYKCRDCALTFKRMHFLKDHAQIVHGSGHNFFCTFCTYSCSDLRDYNRHRETHTVKNHYSCDKCDYTCSRQKKMDEHKLIHSDVFPFMCCLCGCHFRHKSNMKKHIVRHLADKNFQCEICGFRTRSHIFLRKHQLVHTKDKVHKCAVCDYCTRYPFNLKKHEATHFDERSFSCNMCSYTSKTTENLRKHRKRKHKLRG
ncbi:hypothetical protein Btru_068147 [Bulinus truncatus]|nr:hypothetical protein Btru_068147 [Bulinus truncatus]